MTRLTKIEKETIVLFNEGEDKANMIRFSIEQEVITIPFKVL